MQLRKELVLRHLNGESLTDLAREFDISLKTAKKFKARFLKQGEQGLEDRSRAPKHVPHKTTPDLERILVNARKEHPTWGPKKLKVVLERKYKREFPAPSTIGDILLRAGLITAHKRRTRYPSAPTALSVAEAPNDVWCIDYKGQFRLGHGRYCYPLTLTDQFSRFLLGVDAMDEISGVDARDCCEELFREYGLPRAIRSDNGAPFASKALAGLSKLSAYWMLLGIRLERIRPAHPQENGQHERMHRTLKAETTKPPSANSLQQQERFDAFRKQFNAERPHEALKMKTPAEIYKPSKRRYPASLPQPTYDDHDDVVQVTSNGYVTLGRNLVYVSQALSNMLLGVAEQPDGRVLLTFMELDLGHVDRHSNKVVPLNIY